MAQNISITIHIKGGVLSPRQLREISNIANQCGTDNIHFGERQNIYLQISKFKLDYLVSRLNLQNFEFEINEDKFPNIVSSYPAIDILPSVSWMQEGIVQDILDSFTYKPRVKINIVDINQGLVSAFTGHINFIASSHINFWYLYIRTPKTRKLVCWPCLIYSTELALIARELEKYILEVKEFSVDEVSERFKRIHKYISMEMNKELTLPRFKFPYYEGINAYGDQYWLGIYRRNNDFPVQFIENLALLCAETNVGKVYFTPWKSIIVKGIKESDRVNWEMLLGKFGINVRHSSLELNWKTADLDLRAIKLKKYLVKKFDKTDIRTYGLTFAIKTEPGMEMAASVVIKQKPVFRLFGKIPILSTYDIFHTEDFNPNNPNVIQYEKDRVRKDLIPSLIDLCKRYYAKLNEIKDNRTVEEKDSSIKQQKIITFVHRCPNCYTVYDPEYGDSQACIAAGVPFANLENSYTCAVCSTPKNEFEEVKKELQVER